MPFKAQIRNVSYVDQRVDLILTLQWTPGIVGASHLLVNYN